MAEKAQIGGFDVEHRCLAFEQIFLVDILENLGDAENMSLKVLHRDDNDNPATAAQGTDRPGRGKDGAPGHRSALEETDWHSLGKERFARELAQMLYEQAHAGRFRSLVIVAPPEMLGDLRVEIHTEVRARTVAEIAKTLTNRPADEIERVLAAELSPNGG